MIYTKKQRELLHLWQSNQLCRLNILEGSVSSGKTWISLILWALWLATMPKNGLYLMCGKSLTTLKRNCLLLLVKMFGDSNVQFTMPKKEALIFGRQVLLEGANDARSESKIRGLTLQGAYCDELTLFPEDFFTMLLSRLRRPQAKLFATTNPDTPMHWLKRNYIDREGLDLLDMHFLLEDNTTLDKAYIDALKAEYTGVYYERFVLGEWVLADGIIYPQFHEDTHVKQNAVTNGKWYISIDYGTLNAFSAGLWLYDGHAAYRATEWYYSGRDMKKQLTNAEYVTHVTHLAEGKKIEAVIVDPSAASFITELRKNGFTVRKGKNEVADGIRHTASMLAQNRLYFAPNCKNIIKEFGAYRWDETSAREEPIKKNDHAMDDMRYFVNTIMRSSGTAVSTIKGGL